MRTETIINAIKGGNRIGQLSMRDREENIREMLTFAHQMKGKVATGDYLMMAVPAIEKELSHCFPHLTFGEIRAAVNAGLTGEYQAIGNKLDTANVIAWVSCYAKSADRAEAIRTISVREYAADKAIKETVSQAETQRLNAKCFAEEPRRLFQEYLLNGRDCYTTTQYVAEVVYAAKRDDIKAYFDKDPNKAARLKAAKNRAARAMKTQAPSIFRPGGINAENLGSFYKTELVMDWFEYLKQNNLSIN